MENKTKTSQAQKKATAKYLKKHYYAKTVRFREEAFPRERCDLAIKRIQEDGISFSEFIKEKMMELTKDWGD